MLNLSPLKLSCVAMLGALAVCGCSPTGATTMTPESDLGINTVVSEKARANYLLSKEIDRTIVARGSRDINRVALSFDDGPHPGKTEALLATLTRLNVHATFFVVGKMAEKAPYLLQEEVLQGSEVGNHTYDHIHVTALDDAQIAREIFSTNDVIERCTGEPAVLFRPPGGRISWGAYRALRACGMVTVLWTDDPRDYENPGKANPTRQKLLMKRLMEHIQPGGIILLHDGIQDTIDILPELVRELRAKGYEVGTVTQLLLAQQHQELETKRLEPIHPPLLAPGYPIQRIKVDRAFR